MEEIRLLKIRKLEKSGSLLGFADISIGSLEIRGLRIVQANQRFVSMPQQEAPPKQGETKKQYYPIVVAPRELMDVVQRYVLEAFDKGVSQPSQATQGVAQRASEPMPPSRDYDDKDLPF
jgi:DNA-binding cell septation regulator SpoVG